MAKRIKLGMIGGGSTSFIGILHRIASYISEDYEIIGGVFDVDYKASLAFAEEKSFNTNRVYEDLDAFITQENALPVEERIEAVIIVTPNFLHYSQAKALIQGGFHVICEKPVTITSQEAEELEGLIKEKNVVFGLTHTYTGYPMVREMKSLIAQGVIGKVQKVDAQYYQGWLNAPIHDKSLRNSIWRLDPAKAGISSCMGDIGVHAFNMVEYATGLKVDKVLSDLNNVYEDNSLDVDGIVMLRFTEGFAKGVVRASQVATGEENNLQIMIYGEKGGFVWKQEEPTFLYHFIDGEPMRVIKPGYEFNTEFAQESTKMAPGHPEGIFDSMGNIYIGIAKAIRGEDYKDGAFPNIIDGVRGMKFIESAVESNKKNQEWVSL
ncbi:MAG: Gfo/Idh/MocA family oxidoreductase [Reichenbachiella sp.]